ERLGTGWGRHDFVRCRHDIPMVIDRVDDRETIGFAVEEYAPHRSPIAHKFIMVDRPHDTYCRPQSPRALKSTCFAIAYHGGFRCPRTDRGVVVENEPISRFRARCRGFCAGVS